MRNWPRGWLRSGNASQSGSARFLVAGPTPLAALDFERELQELLREVGRLIVELAYNRCEPDEPEQLPHHLEHDGNRYRRLNEKTPVSVHQHHFSG